MTRAEVRQFVEDGINALSESIGFGAGRITEFNKDTQKDYPYAWLESLANRPEVFVNHATVDNWQIIIHIAKKDSQDSSPDEYETIVDECDVIGAKLQTKYNQVVSGYKLLTISNVSREPFIKKHADILSGVVLSFDLSAPETASYCD